MKLKVVERKLGREGAYGLYSSDGLIEVDPRQCSKEMLDTLIHESLHAFEPKWGERRVASCAHTLTRILWKAGYRRIAE